MTLLEQVIKAGLLEDKDRGMLTTRAAAERLGVNTSRIRQLILMGRLKAEKHGRDWMISEDEVSLFQKRGAGRPSKHQSSTVQDSSTAQHTTPVTTPPDTAP